MTSQKFVLKLRILTFHEYLSCNAKGPIGVKKNERNFFFLIYKYLLKVKICINCVPFLIKKVKL